MVEQAKNSIELAKTAEKNGDLKQAHKLMKQGKKMTKSLLLYWFRLF
jgi:hypothetical protein